MRGLVAVVLALVGGCLADPTVRCGDIACPAGDVCTPGGCATPDNAAACGNKPDRDSCTSMTITNGACLGGACHAITCGDHIVDPGEVCDDGNTVVGDGCSATCDSDETCGNGVIDAVTGEECDDGNRRSSDGCSSTCKAEQLVWHDITPTPIAGRWDAMAVDDAALGHVVLFGGRTPDAIVDETWELVGGQWVPLSPVVSPPARAGAGMAYDPVRARVVLFGGSNGAALGDTWELDGVTWTELHPQHAPSPRSSTKMVYMPELGQTVLYGGGNGTVFGDMWSWDGTDWHELAPATTPGPARDHVMAYDSQRHRIVLYGAGSADETWEFDGATWIQRTPPQSPGFLFFTAMTYDARHQRTLLFGGAGCSACGTGVWSWDGSTWTPLVASGPGVRYIPAVAYDSTAQDVVCFGGIVSGLGALDDTWIWDGATWAQSATAAVSPPARISAGFVYDEKRGVHVLFGGGFYATYNDTWIRDRRGWWREVTPAQSPSIRTSFGMAYDAARGQTVLFGGQDASNQFLGDTWLWDGMTWTKVTPPMSPSSRKDVAMAYDAATGRVVLFGGFDATTTYGDTWEWDGTTWVQRSPSSSPSPRYFAVAAAAYDPVRRRVVLFGASETWEWDGTTWIDRTTSDVGGLEGPLVYDAERERVVLLGGIGNVSLGVWEWDGMAWTQRSPLQASPTRRYANVAYDPINHQVLRFGGLNLDGKNATDSSSLRWESVAATERCLIASADQDGDGLAGCADPDCWATCSPACPPGASCAANAPHCGDGVCDAIEDRYICPVDCP